MFWISRSTLRLILLYQYSTFDDGHTKRSQSWWCQKHPFTNTTVLYLVKTISGHSGNSFTFFLYRSPWENKYFRTHSSGFEFLLRMWDIFMLRTSFEWLSAIFLKFLFNRKVHIELFVVNFIKCYISSAICKEILYMNISTVIEFQAFSEIFA